MLSGSIAFQTSSLAAGTYTGIITLTDPNAVDSPQTITVTAQVGGDVPGNLIFYLAPGGIHVQLLSPRNGPINGQSEQRHLAHDVHVGERSQLAAM